LEAETEDLEAKRVASELEKEQAELQLAQAKTAHLEADEISNLADAVTQARQDAAEATRLAGESSTALQSSKDRNKTLLAEADRLKKELIQEKESGFGTTATLGGLTVLGIGSTGAYYGKDIYGNYMKEPVPDFSGITSSLPESSTSSTRTGLSVQEQSQSGDPAPEPKDDWGKPLLIGFLIIMIIGLMVGAGLWYFDIISFGDKAPEVDIENPLVHLAKPPERRNRRVKSARKRCDSSKRSCSRKRRRRSRRSKSGPERGPEYVRRLRADSLKRSRSKSRSASQSGYDYG